MSVLEGLLTDLATETDLLRAAVADLSDEQWQTPTPAPGWTVRDTIGHLVWTDEAAITSATDKAAWDALVATALDELGGDELGGDHLDGDDLGGDSLGHGVDKFARQVGADPDLLARWDRGRARLTEVLRTHEGKISWFGPPMSPTSMATARFMETWAHGLDVREALGLPAVPTDRIRNVCHLGVRTRDFAFDIHGLPRPVEEFGITLAAPSGDIWRWGPADAAQTVTGSAWDFARLVTQRIHRSDTDLVATGPDANQWLDIAQAFAGPPGQGRTAKRAATAAKETLL